MSADGATFSRRRSAARFLALGALSFGTLLGGTSALVEFGGLGPRPAYALMLVLVLAGNFVANRRFVFPAARSGAARAQALRFVVASTSFRALEYALVTGLLLHLLALPYPLAIVLGTGAMLVLKFFVFSRYVFR